MFTFYVELFITKVANLGGLINVCHTNDFSRKRREHLLKALTG